MIVLNPPSAPNLKGPDDFTDGVQSAVELVLGVYQGRGIVQVDDPDPEPRMNIINFHLGMPVK